MRSVLLFVLTVLAASAVVAAEPGPAPVAVPAITIGRDNGQASALTIYAPDGSPIAVLSPDGTVDIKQGTPEEAARAFFKVLTDFLLTQCVKP